MLALVVRLLEATLIRVGNEEYARENRTFGLSTLRDRHVKGEGANVRFSFKGKSGKEHEVPITDRRLARLVKQCQEMPGQELFQYLDGDGRRQSIDSGEVNEYLREITRGGVHREGLPHLGGHGRGLDGAPGLPGDR